MKTTLFYPVIILFCFFCISSNSFCQFEQLKVPFGGQPSEIISITDNKDNSLHVFAVAASRGVYELDSTWKFHSPGNEFFLRKLIPVANNLYVSYLTFGLLKSNDYGKTWTEIMKSDTGEFISSLIHYKSKTIACSNFGRIYTSSNETSWSKKQLPDSLVIFSLYNYLDSTIYGATIHGLYYSKDDGASWNQTDTTFFRSKIIRQIVSTPNKWLYVGTLKGLYRSKDEGKSWTELSNGIFVDNINRIFVYNDSTLLIGTAIGTYYSYDYGDSWTEINKKTNVVNVNSFVKLSDSEILTAASYGIYKGSKDFLSWSDYNEGFENLYFQKFIPFKEQDNIHFLLASENKNLYKSDYLMNWTRKFEGLTYNTFSLSPWRYLYLSSGMGGVLRSKDYGETFEQFYSNNSRGINQFAYDSKGNVYGALNGLAVVITTNQSETWDLYNKGIEGQRGLSIAIDSKDNKYAVTANGFYHVTADSLNWLKVNLQPNIPKLTQVCIGPDDTIYLLSDSLGIYQFTPANNENKQLLSNYKLKKIAVNRFNQLMTFSARKIYLYSNNSWDSTNYNFSKYMTDILDVEFCDDNNLYILTRTSMFKSTTATAVEIPVQNDGMSMDIMPNPAGDYIKFKFDAAPDNLPAVNIYDLEGNKYINQAIGSDFCIDISKLNKGFYLVYVNINNKEILVRKLIKF